MEPLYIDLAVLEDDGRNIFDDIASKMEELSLQEYAMHGAMVTLPLGNKDDILEKIHEIENLLIDIDDSKTEHSQLITDESKKLLRVWFEIWEKNFQTPDITAAFADNLYSLKNTIRSAAGLKNEKHIKDLFSLYKTNEKELKKIAENNKAPLDHVIMSFMKDSFRKTYIAKPSIVGSYTPPDISNFSKFYANDSAQFDFTWEVEIHAAGETSASDFAYFFWTFIESLESIEGVKVDIENVSKGSFIGKIKIKMRDMFAREGVKTVLEKARKSGEAVIEKPGIEVDKLKEEKNKIEVEKEKIAKEIEGMPNLEESKQLHDLRVKRMEAEIEGLKVDNALKKIQGIEKLSQLIKSGILRVDEMQININDILFLDKKGDNVIAEKSIDDISAGETKFS